VRLDPVSLRIRRGDADKRLLSRRPLALCSLVMSNLWLLDVVLLARHIQLVRLASSRAHELGASVHVDLSLLLISSRWSKICAWTLPTHWLPMLLDSIRSCDLNFCLTET
jgi:hypothetical protein